MRLRSREQRGARYCRVDTADRPDPRRELGRWRQLHCLRRRQHPATRALDQRRDLVRQGPRSSLAHNGEAAHRATGVTATSRIRQIEKPSAAGVALELDAQIEHRQQHMLLHQLDADCVPHLVSRELGGAGLARGRRRRGRLGRHDFARLSYHSTRRRHRYLRPKNEHRRGTQARTTLHLNDPLQFTRPTVLAPAFSTRARPQTSPAAR